MNSFSKIFLLFLSLGSSAYAQNYSLTTKYTRTSNHSIQIKMEVDVTKESTGKADILFVVDNSGSMFQHQKNLSSNLDLLLEPFSGYDINAAVITTDMEDPSQRGRFQNGFLNSTSNSNFTSELKKNILVGINGSFDERIFEPIIVALTAPLITTTNKDFLREDAKLVVVFITDAEDKSQSIDQTVFAQLLKSIKPNNPQDIALAGIFIEPGTATSLCEQDQGDGPAYKLVDVLKSFKSYFTNLCSSNFSADISKMSNNIVNDLGKLIVSNRSFKLPMKPDVSTIKVNYGVFNLVAGDFSQGWYYVPATENLHVGDGFDYGIAPLGTKLVIEYTVKP